MTKYLERAVNFTFEIGKVAIATHLGRVRVYRDGVYTDGIREMYQECFQNISCCDPQRSFRTFILNPK